MLPAIIVPHFLPQTLWSSKRAEISSNYFLCVKYFLTLLYVIEGVFFSRFLVVDFIDIASLMLDRL